MPSRRTFNVVLVSTAQRDAASRMPAWPCARWPTRAARPRSRSARPRRTATRDFIDRNSARHARSRLTAVSAGAARRRASDDYRKDVLTRLHGTFTDTLVVSPKTEASARVRLRLSRPALGIAQAAAPTRWQPGSSRSSPACTSRSPWCASTAAPPDARRLVLVACRLRVRGVAPGSGRRRRRSSSGSSPTSRGCSRPIRWRRGAPRRSSAPTKNRHRLQRQLGAAAPCGRPRRGATRASCRCRCSPSSTRRPTSGRSASRARRASTSRPASSSRCACAWTARTTCAATRSVRRRTCRASSRSRSSGRALVSSALHATLRPGSTLHARQPAGAFVYPARRRSAARAARGRRRHHAAHRACCATRCTPSRSGPVVLVQSANRPEGLAFADELRVLQRRHAAFRWVPAVSRGGRGPRVLSRAHRPRAARRRGARTSRTPSSASAARPG